MQQILMHGSTLGPVNLSDYMGKWVVIFSYPKNFEPVSTTELIALSKINTELNNLDTKVLLISCDSNTSNLAYAYSIFQNTNITLPFPILDDSKKIICKEYNLCNHTNNSYELNRSVYILDDELIIQAILNYPLQIGRNITEILRIIEGLQYSKFTNNLIPANWYKNQSTLMNYPNTFTEIVHNTSRLNATNCIDWYLSFNQKFNQNNIIN